MVRFAYASIDENGKTKGGKKGDQTGKELKITKPYQFGQTWRARFINRGKALKAQNIIKFIIKSRQVGYNQNERGTLYALGNLCDWNYSKFKKKLKKTKCNCDCSSLIATVINLTFGKKLVSCFTTATMHDSFNTHILRKYFKMEYAELEGTLTGWRGDILWRGNKHTIMIIK